MRRLWASFSAAGLLIGTLLFAVSLTPSLVPRPFMLQVILSGIALASGYGIGVFVRWLWAYMELPVPRPNINRIVKALATLVFLLVVVFFLLRAATWQNSLHLLMEMDPVESSRPLTLGLLSLLVFAVLLALARLFRGVARLMSRRLNRIVPGRVANVVGVLVAVLLFWFVLKGLVTRWVFSTYEVSFAQLDALIEPETDPPQDAMRTGSTASLVAWRDIGRQGRRFIALGPTRDDLEAFSGPGVLQPLRVYVGLNSAETIRERVALALAEMQRTGAFERSVLVIITPTGTGWVDPGAVNSIEYLHRGDVASVAVQYSYLPSMLSMMDHSESGVATARELFQAVYRHWSGLPHDRRPRVYLHGLSLGALNSQRSADIWDIVADPVHGALWSGPPFRSTTWRWVTEYRNPDSPAWLPRFRDGSVIRFASQYSRPERFAADWGPLRIVYLQYGSDPVTFFEPACLYRAPAWMSEPRAPDLSPSLRWFPLVTALQLSVDIIVGDSAPPGYGHRYATEHYIDAWREVTDPLGWTETEIERLKAHIGDLQR